MDGINPFKDEYVLKTERYAHRLIREIADSRRTFSDNQIKKFVDYLRNDELFEEATFELRYDSEIDLYDITHAQDKELTDEQFDLIINNQIDLLDDEGIINYNMAFKGGG